MRKIISTFIFLTILSSQTILSVFEEKEYDFSKETFESEAQRFEDDLKTEIADKEQKEQTLRDEGKIREADEYKDTIKGLQDKLTIFTDTFNDYTGSTPEEQTEKFDDVSKIANDTVTDADTILEQLETEIKKIEQEIITPEAPETLPTGISPIIPTAYEEYSDQDFTNMFDSPAGDELWNTYYNTRKAALDNITALRDKFATQDPRYTKLENIRSRIETPLQYIQGSRENIDLFPDRASKIYELRLGYDSTVQTAIDEARKFVNSYEASLDPYRSTDAQRIEYDNDTVQRRLEQAQEYYKTQVSEDAAIKEVGVDQPYSSYQTTINQSIADAEKYQKYFEDQATTLDGKADTLERNNQLEAAQEMRTDAENTRSKAKEYEDLATRLKDNLSTIDKYVAAREIGETPVKEASNIDTQKARKAIDDISTELTTKISEDGPIEEEPTPAEEPTTPAEEPTTTPTEAPTEPPAPEKPDSVIVAWFKTTFTKLINSIKNFFRYDPADPPPVETAEDRKTLDAFGTAQSAFDEASFQYDIWKNLYVNTQLGGDYSKLNITEMEEWYKNNPGYADKFGFIADNYDTAVQNLEKIRPGYTTILREQSEAAKAEVLQDLSNFQTDPTSLGDSTPSDINQVQGELAQIKPDREEQKAIDADFRAKYGIENPYTVLGIQDAAQAYTALSKKLGELNIKLSPFITTNNQMVDGTITFEEFKAKMNDLLRTNNPGAYAQDPEQLFKIADAYNLLTEGYVGGTILGRSTVDPDGKQIFYGAKFIDAALGSIRDTFEKQKNDPNYQKIVSDVGSTVFQTKKAMMNL